VNLVKRTGEILLLTDAARDEMFMSDPYVSLRQPRSIFCAPIRQHDQLVGILYLENNLASGAFSVQRTTALRLLVSQAAIALENARLFAEIGRLRDRLQAENVYLQEEIQDRHGFEEIVGRSASLKHLLKEIEQVAPTTTTVLITGETGAGKELVARAIHRRSGRAIRPLVTVNCGAISPGLVESELFGHERGAFTGALSRKIGRFELADGGTIFLDEIGDFPLDLQVKLLRVLQEQEIERVGGNRRIAVDTRVIAATHRDLSQLVTAGRFREDLYYRLNVFPVRTPPLRERREDIPLLVAYFAGKHGAKLGKSIDKIPQRTLDALMAYGWPGNVRELANIIERAVIVSSTNRLELGPWFAAAAPTSETSTPSGRTLEDVERQHILDVLLASGWRVSGPSGAAGALGMKPTTLEARMKRLGISRPR
jgi:transcriptional regulator with GAF, ATPase, and Fis domain